MQPEPPALPVRVCLLGPVVVTTNGTTIDIPVQKHRAVLTVLALRSPGVVTASELIDVVWGDDPPASAEKTLQGYVSALRKSFGTDVIRTVPAGYQLGPAAEHVDAVELDALISTAQRELEHGNPQGARHSFAAALALWRGQPLGDLAPGPARDGQLARLDELQLLAAEGLVVAELRVGHHRDVVPDLERLVAEHPYREPLWQALMLALYRSGRAADALGAYQRLRTTLRDELGIEPSTAAQALERQILGHDPALEATPPTPPTNVTVPLDNFVNRTAEQAAINGVLTDHRLVTVLGIGGVGKSRLANEVARGMLADTAGGVWWIDLASAPSSQSVLVHVAAAMRLPAAPSGALDTVLLARLRGAPTILVLDNCEHLREEVASFVEWVTSHDPLIRVIATSRVPLVIAGEFHVHVEPLATEPDDGHQVSDASRLFLDRASGRADMSNPDIAAVEALTDVVGGLPLGIELAAAQCALRTPDDLAHALHDRGAVLTLAGGERDATRHASLGHVLDTTFDALDPDLAAIAPRLAVFPGDFDLAAATAVLGTPKPEAERDVARLLDASLLTHRPSDAPQRRFRVLWPVREYLAGRLDEPGHLAAEARHARHFRAFALRFVNDANATGEAAWLAQAQFDDHNLRLALAWFEGHDPEGALTFGPGLGWAWQEHGDQGDGRDTLRRLLASAPDAPTELVAWTEEVLCWLEFLSGEAEQAFAHIVEAIARFEELDHPRGLSRALGSQAHALYLGGFDISTVAPLYERSIAVAKGAGIEYARARAEVMFAHALTASEERDRVDVEAMLSHAEPVLRRHGDHTRLAHATLSRANIAFGHADAVAGRVAGEEMLRQSRLAHSKNFEQIGHVALGLSAQVAGAEDESRREFRDAIQLAHGTANRVQLGIALHALAASAAHRAPETAARLWGAAGTMAPLWPLFVRRYGEWMQPAHDTLGERFDDLVADGSRLSVEDAVALADELL